MSYKLFNPGPIAVSEKTYQAMTKWVMGHRSSDFVELFQSVQPGLQELFYTQDPVFISTSSAWGVMEGAIRNVTQKGVLNICCGAFSDKWFDVSKRCNLPCGQLQYDWGQPVDPEDVRKELATGKYDAVTLIHNETSTGTMNPLQEIAAVVREFPEVIMIVDAVSSFSALKIPKDEWGIDVMLTGSQKALAMPPGLALLSVNQRALKRASETPGRGYYFDFCEFQKNYESGMTPSTPVIPLIYALQSKLEDIAAEGITPRYDRHKRLNQMVRDWVAAKGLELLPPQEYASITLCCVKNSKNWDLSAIRKTLKAKFKMDIDGGYGKLKDKTFRISNMGDETDETIAELLNNLDTVLAELGCS